VGFHDQPSDSGLKKIEPVILFTELSPNGNIEAVVEQDDRVAYFYLNGSSESDFRVRSCWIRNLRPAPEEFDQKTMQEGIAPLLPRKFCKHPTGARPLDGKNLNVVWFEEGDAAALFLSNTILAVIPPWSGIGGFHGYAAECVGESLVCWGLGTPETNEIFRRISRAQEYWISWSHEKTWLSLQKSFMDAYKTQLGSHSKYYAIDNNQWPPKAILEIPTSQGVYLVTLGISIRPQPKIEMYLDEPEKYRRVEIGFYLGKNFSEKTVHLAANYLSALAAYPWKKYAWISEFHTIDCGVIPPNSQGIKFSYIILSREQDLGITLPEYRDDPVNLYWAIPITETERQFAEKCGINELVLRLRQQNDYWPHNDRSEIVFD